MREAALKKTPLLACASIMGIAGVTTAWADNPGQPFTNIQPSLALTEVIPTGAGGVFPSFTGGGALGNTDGFVYDFAGNYAPSGSVYANGQLLPITGNSAVFSLMGTILRRQRHIQFRGAEPDRAGDHRGRRGCGVAGADTGGPHGNRDDVTDGREPSTADGQRCGRSATSSRRCRWFPLIAINAPFPSNSSANAPAFIGQIGNYAGSLGSSGQFTPNGWAVANGALLPIAGNTALFSVSGHDLRRGRGYGFRVA